MRNRLATTMIGLAAAAAAAACGGAQSASVQDVAAERMVVLGRVLVYYDGELVSGRTTVYAAGPGDERIDAESYQLPDDGAVVWELERPWGQSLLRWTRVTTSNESSVLELGENAPLLHPAGEDHDVYYFGTMVLVVGEEIPEELSDYDFVERSRVIHVALGDRAEDTLPELAKDNPSIRGLQYYNVPRGAVATAPMGE